LAGKIEGSVGSQTVIWSQVGVSHRHIETGVTE